MFTAPFNNWSEVDTLFDRTLIIIVKMTKVFSQRRYVMDILYVGIVVALFVLSLLFVKLVEKV